MKKYRLQEGLAWICFRCRKKILSEEDMIMYDHRIYHKKCALTLLEKLKKKLFKKGLGAKGENIRNQAF